MVLHKAFPEEMKPCSVMMFVDGENLSMRWQEEIGDETPPAYVLHTKDVFVWTEYLNVKTCGHNVIRKHYYTSVLGDEDKRYQIADTLKDLGIEAPYVFHRSKTRGSKRVDITLSVEMLVHAYQKNYDVAVLVAGDEDYVPLVEAVKNIGRRVFVWFVRRGLSPKLKRASDYYCDISDLLCRYLKEYGTGSGSILIRNAEGAKDS